MGDDAGEPRTVWVLTTVEMGVPEEPILCVSEQAARRAIKVFAEAHGGLPDPDSPDGWDFSCSEDDARIDNVALPEGY